MKNTIIINLDDSCGCECVDNTECSNNSINLQLLHATYKNPILEITKADGTIITPSDFELNEYSNILYYTLPQDLYTGTGTIKIRVIDTDFTGDYIEFTLNGITDARVIVRYQTGKLYDVRQIKESPDLQAQIEVLNSKLAAIFSGEQLETTVTAGDNYSTASGNVYRTGNILRLNFNVTRKSALSAGDVTNEKIASFSFKHGGKIASIYNVSSCTASTGGVCSFYTTNTKVDSDTRTIDVYVSATASQVLSMNAYIVLPVTLNMDAF